MRAYLNTVRKMLHLDPKERISVAIIADQLYVCAQASIFQTIRRSFKSLEFIPEALKLIIERERIFLWGGSCGLVAFSEYSTVGMDDSLRNWLWKAHLHFLRIHELLASLLQECGQLKVTLENGPNLSKPVYSSIRNLNDSLWTLAPSAITQIMSAKLEERILQVDDRDAIVIALGTLADIN